MSRWTRADRPLDVLRRVSAVGRRGHGRRGHGRRDDGRPVFLDGLLLGAMVGAAIAGSTAWARWQARRREPERGRSSAGPEPRPRD